MFRFLWVILLVISQFAFGQIEYVNKEVDPTVKSTHGIPKEFQRKLSFQAFVGGSGSGNQFAPTGYQYVNGANIEMRTNGGGCAGLKASYTLSNKLEIELGYEYQFSGLKEEVLDGLGKFERHLTSPVLKYNLSIIPKELAIYFYAGANFVFASNLYLAINFPNGKDEIEYIYNPSLGAIIGTELEIYSGRLFSLRFGLNHNINYLRINRAYHNDKKVDAELLDADTKKFYSNSAFIYIGGVFNIQWTQKLNR